MPKSFDVGAESVVNEIVPDLTSPLCASSEFASRFSASEEFITASTMSVSVVATIVPYTITLASIMPAGVPFARPILMQLGAL